MLASWRLYLSLQFDLQTAALSSSLAAAPVQHDLLCERDVFVIAFFLIPARLPVFFFNPTSMLQSIFGMQNLQM